MAEKSATRAFSLLHHGGRCAGHEALVAQFGLGLGDLALQAGDFLAQADLLGLDVDLDVQGQARFAVHGHRGHAGGGGEGGFVQQLDLAELAQGLEDGRGLADEIRIARGEQGNALGRR